jgi:hypothetical protein
MKILGKFYLSSGQVIEERISYKKANEKVTNEEFKKEIEKIVQDSELYLSEQIFSRSPKVFPFGHLMVKITDISAFQFFIEDEEINETDFYNDFTTIDENEVIAIEE